ncbi:MAG: helix-turn-helix transcriptional regulator [Paenalcaligenes sp.]
MNSIPNIQSKVFSRMSADLTKATPVQEKLTLDDIEPKALYRWGQIKDVLPISESTWRRRIAERKAPSPITLSTRCTLWRGADVLEWLKHPDKYSAK